VLSVVEFPRIATGARHVTRPVVVTRSRAVVRGRVVDPQGRPAGGVRVLLTTASGDEPAAMGHFATRSDEQGRFEVLADGALPEGSMVCGRATLGFCAPVRVGAAGEDVELTLLPAGAIEVDLGYPRGLGERPSNGAGWAAPMLTLTIDPASLSPSMRALFRDRTHLGQRFAIGRWSQSAALPKQGVMRFDDLVPATYRVRAAMGVNPLLDVPGVVVRSGEVTRPPQLRGFELGAGIARRKVRVVDFAGDPVAAARVRFSLPSWEKTLPNGTNAATDERGEAWFLLPERSVVDVEVVARGHAPTRRKGVTLPVEITVGAGTTFDLQVEGIEALQGKVRATYVVAREIEGDGPDSPVRKIGRLEQLWHPQAKIDPATGKGALANLPAGHYRLWLGTYLPIRHEKSVAFVAIGDHRAEPGAAVRAPVQYRLTPEDVDTLVGR